MIKSFTIDRATWLNGKLVKDFERAGLSQPESMLLDAGGRMCCLGFYAEACGVPKKALKFSCNPYNVDSNHQSKIAPTIDQDGRTNSPAADALIEANDDDELTPSKREAKIVSGFKKIGVSVKFKGKYPIVKKSKDL